uniref:Uncharacterized protein n=1 Tax=Aureoumbra lagunensis TaxID=44058 RepID=A0A7S3JV01_9STRA
MRSPRTPQQRHRCQIKGSAKVENGHIFHSLLALHHSDSPSCHEIGEKEDVNKKKEGTPVQKRRVKKVEHGKSLEPNVFTYIAPAVEAEHDDDIAQEMPRPNGPPHSEPLPRKKPQRPAPNPPSYNTPSTPLTERQALQRYRRIERQRELTQSTDQTIKKTEKKLYHAKSQVFSARLRVISQAERLSKQEARISHVRNHSQNELTLELLHQDDQNDEHQQQIEKKKMQPQRQIISSERVQFSGPILEEFIAGLWIAMRCEIVQVQPHTSLFRVFRADNQLPGPVSTIDLSIHVYKGTAFSLGHRHFRACDTSQRNIWLDAFIDAGATPITNCPVDIHTFLFGNCAPIYDLVFPASHYSQEGNYVSEDHQTHSLPQVQSQVDNKAQNEEYDPLAAKERIERRQLQAQDRAEFLDAENEVDRQKQKQIELKQIQAMKRAESEQAQEQIERKYFEPVTENEMRSKKEAESESDKTVANKQKEVTVQRRLSLLQRVQAIEREHFEQRQADSPKKVVKPLSQVDQEFLKSEIVQCQTQAELQKLKQAERVRAEIAAKEETERQKERAEIAAKEEAERQKERAEIAANEEAERQKERADNCCEGRS